MTPEQTEELLALARAGGARLTDLQKKYGQYPTMAVLSKAGFGWDDDIVAPRVMLEPEASTAPRSTKTRGDRGTRDFQPDNSSEEWFHCKAPFLRFAVSNHRRVAWLVNAGHGVKAGKIATSRPRIIWMKGKPLSIHSVRLTDDAGKKREMNVEWLFQNAAGLRKAKKSSASQSGVI
jgi:hypothetical protein